MALANEDTMKLKISVIIILLTTVAAIGMINLMLSKAPKEKVSPETKAQETLVPAQEKHEEKPSVSFKANKSASPVVLESDEGDEYESDEDDEASDDPSNTYGLTQEDVQKIDNVVGLSESDLTNEIKALKMRIEEEDLFDKLENGDLPADKQNETKSLLERFALLGLEETRRKYVSVEPELANPYYAHRESLAEIKELLEDEL